MYTTEQTTPTKTIMITVNGEPIGRKLIIDSVTYAPVTEPEWAPSMTDLGMNQSTL
ncbi:hypothetical protein [Paenibacillus xylanilyticus]|uniref:Uncharacterized protein n=1 Tax=Paenibacillus xylanilyticus TaxID=248903 RepID=A0A7Y6EX57_9BACL|nr:hypothetical protein [Paenibacillus xylanilyticus]NUU78506.1 hypothetical protein [Paenibacillus xylanilyticus]